MLHIGNTWIRRQGRREGTETCNTDQGGQFTREAFVGFLLGVTVHVSVDGRRCLTLLSNCGVR